MALIITAFAYICANAQPRTYNPEYEIYFKVGKYNLNPNYMGNAQILSFLKDSLPTTFTKGYYQYTLKEYGIVGSASPEGKYSFNVTLSRKRAESVASYLKKHTNLQNTQYQWRGNNWAGLYLYVSEDSAVPYQQEVLDILNDIPLEEDSAEISAKLLKRLQQLRGGEPYRYLLKNIFPRLRYTHFYAYYNSQPRHESVLPVKPMIKAWSFEKPIIPQPKIEETSKTLEERKYRWAIKTNALYDILITPNIGVEFGYKKYSLAANWMYAWWKSDPDRWYHRTYGGDIALRRWFGKERTDNRPFTGFHAGIYAQMLTYDFIYGDRGYLGDKWSYGLGVEGGWSKALGERLNLDLNLGVGYLWGEYMEYIPVDGCYVWQATNNRRWIGPTKAEVSLVWLLGKW